MRPLQAAFEERQRLLRLALLFICPAKVEERERVVGIVLIVQVQQPQVAFFLLAALVLAGGAAALLHVPLWRASGSGAVARQIVGTTVIGGMLAASAFGIFLIPPIFYLVEKWSGSATGQRQALPEPGGIAGPATPAASEGD